MKSIHIAALVLVVIGALNWGLVGLFQYDVVAALFGGVEEPLSRIVYGLVGLGGVVIAFTSAKFLSEGRPAARHHEAPTS